MLVYPKRYNAEEVDRNGFGPTNVNGTGAYSGGIGMGGSEEYCIIVLDDELADEYAQDPDMEIVDEDTADALMEQWRINKGESDDIITDPERIRAISVKQAAGIELTQSDRDALNANSNVRGINKRLIKVADLVAKGGHKMTPVHKKKDDQ
jgi:hypothetical protein